MTAPNIPATTHPRIVIIGAGFGGLTAADKLLRRNTAAHGFQVVLLDRNNYHQFQPLFYQVATAFLEPSAIAFPLRKHFQHSRDLIVRVAEVTTINTAEKTLDTTIGNIAYDYLIIATGADTNYFGMKNIEANALPMKSIAEALGLRNRLLQNFERAVTSTDADERAGLLNIAVVGGGPTGVEVAGTLAEMKRYILPKDYPELDFASVVIRLYENSPVVLEPMSKASQTRAKRYLTELGVEVCNGVRVLDYDGNTVTTSDAQPFRTDTVVWAAGVRGVLPKGIPTEAVGRGGRLLVDAYCKVTTLEGVYAVGDVALMQGSDAKYPNGHPQVAPVSMQMAELVAKNLHGALRGTSQKAFAYFDKGSMATVGRNKAVVDLPFLSFGGIFAWFTWMFVHLMSLMGMRNKVQVFFNWFWNYVTFDQSLRLLIRPSKAANATAEKVPSIAP